MQKKSIFIGMLAVLLALSFMGCSDILDEGFYVTFTDIDSAYNGKYGTVGFTTSLINADDVVAASYAVKISGGSFKGEMLGAEDKPFTEKGNYYVILFITNTTSLEDDVYVGVTPTSRGISGDITISFNTLYGLTSIKLPPEIVESVKNFK